MQIVRILLTALFAAFAVFAGLIAAAVVAIIGLAYVLVRRVRGKQVAAGERPPREPIPAQRDGEVIDVTATEIRSGPRLE
jgi:hypothetical protein